MRCHLGFCASIGGVLSKWTISCFFFFFYFFIVFFFSLSFSS